MNVGSFNRGRLSQRIILYVIFAVITVFFLFPVLWTLSLSLKRVPELYEVPPRLLPRGFAIENYIYIITHYQILRSLANSAYITFCTVIGCLAISLPAAYAFSRFKFKLSEQTQFVILMFQMVSPLVIVIPLYRYYSSIHLLNTFSGLIAIYIAISAPFQVWFLKGFLDTIPRDLDEAARIDGCTRLQVVLRILMPVIAPGLLSSVLLTAILSWSQFVVPYILVDSFAKMPMAVALVNLQSTLTSINTHFMAGASILSILPTVLLFLFLQKYIVSALTAGAVKG
jgi:multiple sugar transport system permease protein